VPPAQDKPPPPILSPKSDWHSNNQLTGWPAKRNRQRTLANTPPKSRWTGFAAVTGPPTVPIPSPPHSCDVCCVRLAHTGQPLGAVCGHAFSLP